MTRGALNGLFSPNLLVDIVDKTNGTITKIALGITILVDIIIEWIYIKMEAIGIKKTWYELKVNSCQVYMCV